MVRLIGEQIERLFADREKYHDLLTSMPCKTVISLHSLLTPRNNEVKFDYEGMYTYLSEIRGLLTLIAISLSIGTYTVENRNPGDDIRKAELVIESRSILGSLIIWRQFSAFKDAISIDCDLPEAINA